MIKCLVFMKLTLACTIGFVLLVCGEGCSDPGASQVAVVPKQFDAFKVNSPSSEWDILMDGGSFGYKTPSGKTAIPAQFESVTYFSDGRAGVRLNGKWYVIDAEGKRISKKGFDYFDGYSEGFAGVGVEAVSEMKYGYIDRDGNVVVDLKYDNISKFSSGFGLVWSNGQAVFVFPDGDVAATFSGAKAFHDGLAPAKVNESWGYIDQSFDFVIDPMFSDAGRFVGERAAVCIDGKVGYIDRKGDLAIPAIYRHGYNFVDGFAPVEADDGWVLIDSSGSVRTRSMLRNEILHKVISTQIGCLGWIEKMRGVDNLWSRFDL